MKYGTLKIIDELFNAEKKEKEKLFKHASDMLRDEYLQEANDINYSNMDRMQALKEEKNRIGNEITKLEIAYADFSSHDFH